MDGIPQPKDHPLRLRRQSPRNAWVAVVCVWIACFGVLESGCHRATYRNWADREVEGIVAGQQDDARWLLPARPVEAHPHSRMFDANDPDCGDRPVDDPAALCRLVWPNGIDNERYWDRIPQSVAIDDGGWMAFLPRNADGRVSISRETAIDLALIHNRNYQNQVESIYLSALGLSSNRFEFVTQWFAGNSTNYTGGKDFGNLSSVNRYGLTRNLAAGGQLAASMVNSLTWQFSPSSSNFSTGNILLSFTQPLLRGAFRHVRLESLAQNERELLYEIRDFAHFRRQFYLDITSSYLAILAQLQSLRNQRKNLESLELNLRETQERFEMQMVSQISVDQVFQEYQNGRIGILQSEQSYQDSLDQFKFTLGLPSHVPITIDETLLEPFELNNPRLDELQTQADQLVLDLSQTLPPEEPDAELLVATRDELIDLQDALQEIVPQIQSELQQWESIIEAGPRENALEEEKIDLQQQQELLVRVREQLENAIVELQEDIENRTEWLENLAEQDPATAWATLSRAVGRRYREQLSTLFIAQTQIRLFLISVVPFDIEEQEAIEYALAERLDLMNQRARVNDAFRGVEVAADALQSDLDVSAVADIGTDPGRNNAFGFDSSANSYSVGVDFDGPLNRLNERNTYRSAQINYQQSRRSFMAEQDSIVNQIRSDLRSLKINYLNFQISRQQLISATRQVEVAQFNLRSAAEATDTNLTRDLLDALGGLLDARNGLIGNWISYEIARITLFVDLELLYLDDDGRWLNESAQTIEGASAQGPGGASIDTECEPVIATIDEAADPGNHHVGTNGTEERRDGLAESPEDRHPRADADPSSSRRQATQSPREQR